MLDVSVITLLENVMARWSPSALQSNSVTPALLSPSPLLGPLLLSRSREASTHQTAKPQFSWGYYWLCECEHNG